MQQQNVDIFGPSCWRNRSIFGARLAGGRRAVFGHQPVAVARQAFERDGQHLRHAVIALGGFEETNAAVVGVADQAGELFLPEFALRAPLVVPVPKASRVTFTFDLPSVTQSVAVRLVGVASTSPPVAPDSTEAATLDFKKSRRENWGIASLL